jgi:hypothetical protein
MEMCECLVANPNAMVRSTLPDGWQLLSYDRAHSLMKLECCDCGKVVKYPEVFQVVDSKSPKIKNKNNQ